MKIPNCPICRRQPTHSFSTDKQGEVSKFSYSCVGFLIINGGLVDRSWEHSPLNTARQPTREAARQNWIQIVRDVKRGNPSNPVNPVEKKEVSNG